MRIKQSIILPAVLATTLSSAQAATSPTEPVPMRTEVLQGDATDLETIGKTFAKAYVAAGKPRLVVYLNRELSDEVREWVTDTRDLSVIGSPSAGKAFIQQGLSATQVRDHNDTEVSPGTDWQWQFEEAVLEPLINNGVRVVDRTLINRTIAAKLDHSDSTKPLALKQIEMNALSQFADLLVEIRINNKPRPGSGYRLHTKVVNIKDGAVLMAEQLDSDSMMTDGAVYTASRHGYHKTASKNVLPDQAGNAVVSQLMQDLSSHWTILSR